MTPSKTYNEIFTLCSRMALLCGGDVTATAATWRVAWSRSLAARWTGRREGLGTETGKTNSIILLTLQIVVLLGSLFRDFFIPVNTF